MKIYRSAYKHGCTETAIRTALRFYTHRSKIGDDPEKWLYLGFSASGQPLEIVTMIDDNGDSVVIYAMKLRKKYQPLLTRRRPQ